jgi:hypothetical protein
MRNAAVNHSEKQLEALGRRRKDFRIMVRHPGYVGGHCDTSVLYVRTFLSRLIRTTLVSKSPLLCSQQNRPPYRSRRLPGH